MVSKFFERLKKNPNTKDIPVIAISASAMQKGYQKSVKCGFLWIILQNRLMFLSSFIS